MVTKQRPASSGPVAGAGGKTTGARPTFLSLAWFFSGPRWLFPAGVAGVLFSFGLMTAATAREAPVAEADRVESVVMQAHAQFRAVGTGELPDYIPALQAASPDLFGITVVTVEGQVYSAGDSEHAFAIMSAAKPFTLGLVMQQHGADAVVERIGVEPTGMPFNSLVAIEIHEARSVNPLVNAGALASASLVKGETAEGKWHSLLSWYGAFAGDVLELDQAVYQSVRETGHRNRAVVDLLYSYNRLYDEPEAVRDLYNRQSSVAVNTRQLAMMGATLANGGIQPGNGQRLLPAEDVSRILAVMMMAGMYDGAGLWAWEVGLPAKSGVGGGIIAIAPGEMAIAAFSPLLDEDGNSVRAQLAIRHIAEALDLGLFSQFGKE